MEEIKPFFISSVLYAGRPEEAAGRLPKEMRVYDLLDHLGISYFRLDHDPAATIEACHDIDQRLGIEICKNLFLCNAQKTDFYLLLLPGYKKLKTSLLSKQLGVSRLSFAPPEQLKRYLDLTPGSVTILGLMNDIEKRVRLLIDQVILEQEFLVCHPCINTSSLKLKTEDVFNRLLPALNREYQVISLTE